MDHRAIFDASPNPYMVLDHELRYVAANAAYLRVTASRLEDLLGRVIFEVFPHDPDDPANESARILRASLEAARRTKQPDHLALVRYRVPRETPGGVVLEDRYWSATHTPILDARGEVAFILQHTSDVTELERLRAERGDLAVTREQLGADVLARAEVVQATNRTLDAERSRLRQLFAQAPGFMCVLRGPDHVFELANRAYLELVGARDLIGKPLREALPEVTQQGFVELLDRVRASGEPFVGRDVRVSLMRADGAAEERFLDFVYQPVSEADGTVSGIFVQGHDVTEQRRAKDEVARYREHLEELVAERTRALEESEAALRQAHKMEAVGSLTGGVAHDFNNLLQVIGGNLALLLSDVAGDERATRRVREAIGAVERGAKLSSQLLAFARRQTLEPEVVDLGQLLHDVEPLVRRAVGEHVELERDLPADLWRTHVDRNLLENVVLNLAINARDAMSGAGRLRITGRNVVLGESDAARHPDATPGEHVVIAITDTGCGMTPELLERVFEPFFTTKEEGRGTGLGLSMVYGFVRQSGGHVEIESAPGRGTTISIHLPRDAREPSAVTALRDAAAAPASGRAETILVVEDDDAVRATVGDLLRELGYRVITAESGARALERLATERVDLLFTDVAMRGGLDGTDVALRARAQRPGLAVLYTSGHTGSVRLEQGATLLRKPYTRDELARRVREALDAATPASAGEAGGAMRVLVVEDDEDSRLLACEMLAVLGHEVVAATSAAEAGATLRSESFDVLFTDVGLPDASGVELARGAVREHGALSVVLASGYGESALDGDDGELGGAVVLTKPYFIEQVEAALRALRR